MGCNWSPMPSISSAMKFRAWMSNYMSMLYIDGINYAWSDPEVVLSKHFILIFFISQRHITWNMKIIPNATAISLHYNRYFQFGCIWSQHSTHTHIYIHIHIYMTHQHIILMNIIVFKFVLYIVPFMYKSRIILFPHWQNYFEVLALDRHLHRIINP